MHIGYPDATFGVNYYTAQVRPRLGVMVAKYISRYWIQFFPWGEDTWEGANFRYETPFNGHVRYARYTAHNARRAQVNTLARVKYVLTSDNADPLTIKCLIENALDNFGDIDDFYQACGFDPATGKTVE